MFVSVCVECGFSHFEGTSEIQSVLKLNAAENIYSDQVSLFGAAENFLTR
jgi:hypothetical protein